MKPKLNYRSRPVKSGAKKRQKLSAQKKRLIAAGYDEETLRRKTTVEFRDLLKEIAKK